MKYFVCTSAQFSNSFTFTTFIVNHNGLIYGMDDIMTLTKEAEVAYNERPENRKGYTSFILVSYTRIDTSPLSSAL